MGTSVASENPLLHAYCHLCERWRVLEADSLGIEWAPGSTPPAVAQCPDCGEFGLVRMRLPPSSSHRPTAAACAVDELPREHWRTPD
jgi:hypothetical protein